MCGKDEKHESAGAGGDLHLIARGLSWAVEVGQGGNFEPGDFSADRAGGRAVAGSLGFYGKLAKYYEIGFGVGIYNGVEADVC